MNWFQHLANGNVAAARMLLNGINKGDTVYINTKTAPTPTGECIIKATVSAVNADGSFDTHEGDPYFGYNKNWNVNQIVA